MDTASPDLNRPHTSGFIDNVDSDHSVLGSQKSKMSNFLEHVEFLMGSSRDHSGDRVLDRWASCVRVFCLACKVHLKN